ncbi:MAG: hypothetical protein AB1505_25425 [Candidatus Latescibacterota bacterium]
MLRCRCTLRLVLLAAAVSGCAGLIPPHLDYIVKLSPRLPEGDGSYSIDLADSSVTFSKEGAQIRLKHLTDDELDVMFPPLFDGRHINPYTHYQKDPRKGYVPPRFTVFQITVSNATYAKIEFDPGRAVLITDRGEEFLYYDAGREGANPLGGNSFTKYYKTELGISGNEKELSLERMGTVYKTIYHRGRPVFREDRRTGMLVFDALPENTRAVRLQIRDFVLSFDASDNPEDTVDVEFQFHVDRRIVEVPRKGSQGRV